MTSDKAEGASDAYSVLGSLVLLLFAWTQLIIPGYYQVLGGIPNGVFTLILGLILLAVTIIAFIASEVVRWTIPRSSLVLIIFGFAALFITLQGLNFDLLAWLSNVGALGSLMLILSGFLKWFG
jgi:hypothetical protein